jgi:hypothetical protein
MLLRPHLRILRKRLIIAAAFTLFVVLSTYFSIVAGDHPTVGVFWHSACTCPVDPGDVRILLKSALVFPFIAIGLGYTGYPAVATDNRFSLTRPQSRLDMILTPTLITATAVTLLPGAAWLLLLGWLNLVHAPALAHLVATFELMPTASYLGPHPSFFALIFAAHLARIYLAGISLALSFYVFLISSRWLIQSRFTTVKLIGFLSSVAVIAIIPAARHLPPSLLLFFPSNSSALNLTPSISAIAFHFAFAAAWFYFTLWIIRDSEI